MDREQALRELQEKILMIFEGNVHFDRRELDWYSRDRETIQWRKDRKIGYRFRLLDQYLAELIRAEDRTPEVRFEMQRLRSRQAQYAFLKGLLDDYWDLPEPPDFRTNREGR